MSDDEKSNGAGSNVTSLEGRTLAPESALRAAKRTFTTPVTYLTRREGFGMEVVAPSEEKATALYSKAFFSQYLARVEQSIAKVNKEMGSDYYPLEHFKEQGYLQHFFIGQICNALYENGYDVDRYSSGVDERRPFHTLYSHPRAYDDLMIIFENTLYIDAAISLDPAAQGAYEQATNTLADRLGIKPLPDIEKGEETSHDPADDHAEQLDPAASAGASAEIVAAKSGIDIEHTITHAPKTLDWDDETLRKVEKGLFGPNVIPLHGSEEEDDLDLIGDEGMPPEPWEDSYPQEPHDPNAPLMNEKFAKHLFEPMKNAIASFNEAMDIAYVEKRYGSDEETPIYCQPPPLEHMEDFFFDVVEDALAARHFDMHAFADAQTQERPAIDVFTGGFNALTLLPKVFEAGLYYNHSAESLMYQPNQDGVYDATRDNMMKAIDELGNALGIPKRTTPTPPKSDQPDPTIEPPKGGELVRLTTQKPAGRGRGGNSDSTTEN